MHSANKFANAMPVFVHTDNTRNLQNHNHQKEIKDKRYFPTEAKGNTEPPWIPIISCAGVSKCKSLTLHLNPCLYQGIDNRRKSTIALNLQSSLFQS